MAKRVSAGYEKKTRAASKINNLGSPKGAEKARSKKTNHEKNHESAEVFRLLVRAMSAVTELYRSDDTRPGFVLSDLGSDSAGLRWYSSIVRYENERDRKVLLSSAYGASAEAAIAACVKTWLGSTKVARGLMRDAEYLEVSE